MKAKKNTLVNRNSVIRWILTVTVLLHSCKSDFLDVSPKGKSIAETTGDFEALLNGTSQLTFFNDLHMLGDEVAAVDKYYSTAYYRQQNAFSYQDNLYRVDDSQTEYYFLAMNLYIYNKIINEVMAAKGGSEQQKRSIRAEALVARAWANFMMVKLYTKPYVQATAATDQGIIMQREASVTASNFTRGKLQEAYDWIINDLQTALPDLPEQTATRMRCGKITGEVLLAQVYFMMGRYTDALPLLSSSLTRLPKETTPLGLYDYAKELKSDGAFYPIHPLYGPMRQFISSSYADHETLFYRMSLNYNYYAYAWGVLSKETMALFSDKDQRRAFTNTGLIDGNTLPPGIARACGDPYENSGLNVPEIYLQLAECQARSGELTAAVETIEILRRNRMPQEDVQVPASIATDRSALIRFILDEGIRETYMTPYRWFEMRRLSVDEEFKDRVKMEHKVYDMDGNIVQRFPLRPERLTLRFPFNIKNANPALEQNP